MSKRRKHRPFLVDNQPPYLIIHPSDPAFRTPLGLGERERHYVKPKAEPALALPAEGAFL